jgi:hypothetical protein
MSYFVEDLLEAIKNRSFAPISQNTIDDDALISMADDELGLSIVSAICGVKEDFFMTTEDTSVIQNTSHYSIPSRAIANALKKVYLVDSAGNEAPLTYIDASRRNEYELTGSPCAYYFEGDEIVLVPKPSATSGTIRFLFPAKPNTLIATSSCAKITGSAVGVSTVVFDVDTDLSASLTTSSYVDVLSSVAPFKLWKYKALIQAISSTQITLLLSDVIDQAGVNVEPQVNDYICPTGFANIPQIPIVFHSVLAQKMNVRLLGSLGDLNKKAAEQAEYMDILEKALKLIRNRVEASPRKISNRSSLTRYLK